MINYKCPKCGARIGLLVEPTAPVECSGWKYEQGGTRRRVHSPILCVLVDENGETKPQPTKTKESQMAKEASNLCGCYSNIDKNGVHTSCGRLVKGKFAPGHDAKLKGMLIRAAVAGEQFKTQDKGGKVVSHDPKAFAKELGWEAQIAKGLATAAAKANKPKRASGASASAKANKVAPKDKVSRDELKARAAKKAAAAKAAAAKKEASLV